MVKQRLAKISLAGVLLIGMAALKTGTIDAHAATAQRASSSFSPVVIERFSLPSPKVGQEETVYAQLLNHDKPVKGARLVATVYTGKHRLAVVHGSTTDAKGQAEAQFRIPSSARGSSLRVTVALTHRQYTIHGRDDLRVAR